MKSAVFTAPKTIELQELPIPEVGPGQLRIRIKYCALCGTDYHCIFSGLSEIFLDWSFGHEFSGYVDEVSPEAEAMGFHVGDPVTAFVLDSCNACDSCKAGKHQYCEKPGKLHVTGFAEYCTVNVGQVHHIPEGLSLMEASLTDPTACCIRGIDMADLQLGYQVAISGVGGIGSILLNLILLDGGCNVTVIDPIPEKLEMARSMGVKNTINPAEEDVVARSMELTDGHGFDYIFEASGAPSAGILCPKMLAQCGTIEYFAVYPVDYEMPLNLFDLYMHEGKVCTSYVTPDCFPRALNILPRMRTDLIIGKVMPLSEVVEAFKLFKTAKYPKIIIECTSD